MDEPIVIKRYAVDSAFLATVTNNALTGLQLLGMVYQSEKNFNHQAMHITLRHLMYIHCWPRKFLLQEKHTL